MNAFETYAKAAKIRVMQPQKLVGSIKTRSAGRERYAEILAEIRSRITNNNPDPLHKYLASIASELAQFRAELEFYWEGDGAEMRGLAKEIEWAIACCDERLDLPRWPVRELEAEGLTQ